VALLVFSWRLIPSPYKEKRGNEGWSELVYESLTGEGEKGVNIHGRANCTYNSEYHNANKDIWNKEGLGGKNTNKE
jgi:hypothetical protein